MASDRSVTHWIGQLGAGDSAAVQKLWEAYFPRMVELARRQLRDLPRRAADEEDVALSAFKSFYRGARDGRFPRLLDRDALWALLVALTKHKAVDLLRHERRRKRGGTPSGPAPAAECLMEAAAPELTPEAALQAAEEFQRLLDRLDDPLLQAVALWKMEGRTTEEIAGQLDCVPRTVERKLRIIRRLWGEEG